MMDQKSELNRLREQLDDMQTQLLQSEKLAVLSSLAAGVAHELNNPIGFVKNNLIMLDEYLEALVPAMRKAMTHGKGAPGGSDDGEDLAMMLDDIGPLMQDSREGIQRVLEIVAGLRSFARADSAQGESFDLNQCVTDTLKVAWNELKYKAKVNRDLQDLPDLSGKPGEINQVILNLLVNAAQAIAQFGEIRIQTRRLGDEVRLSIADDGAGIPEEHLQKLFTPFFTTKPVGKGTGLGLSISSDIVTAHGGRIEVASQAGRGSEFQVFLPVPKEALNGAKN